MITLIRKAIPTDLDRLMEIFSIARRFMQTTGNPNQWINGYPQRELIAQEIEADHCYAVENESGIIIATFCFIQGPDPTYAYIEDGQWPNDRPYYVIHRLASDGTCPGIGKYCFDWCFQQFPCLRADTHADNKVMQHVLTKNGFTRCGIIYVSNGTHCLSERLNIQRILTECRVLCLAFRLFPVIFCIFATQFSITN